MSICVLVSHGVLFLSQQIPFRFSSDTSEGILFKTEVKGKQDSNLQLLQSARWLLEGKEQMRGDCPDDKEWQKLFLCHFSTDAPVSACLSWPKKTLHGPRKRFSCRGMAEVWLLARKTKESGGLCNFWFLAQCQGLWLFHCDPFLHVPKEDNYLLCIGLQTGTSGCPKVLHEHSAWGVSDFQVLWEMTSPGRVVST